MFWDYLSQNPESIHQVMILFSDRGTPDGYVCPLFRLLPVLTLVIVTSANTVILVTPSSSSKKTAHSFTLKFTSVPMAASRYTTTALLLNVD
jgi:Catalase